MSAPVENSVTSRVAIYGNGLGCQSLSKLIDGGYDHHNFPLLEWDEQFVDTSPKRVAINGLEGCQSALGGAYNHLVDAIGHIGHCALKALEGLAGSLCIYTKPGGTSKRVRGQLML